MTNIYPIMKEFLPHSVSFKLRVLKAQAADSDTKDFRKFLRIFSDPEAIAVDIGANFGLYSALLSKHFKGVISVEPNPICVSYMSEVLPLTCSISQCALSDREGQASLRIPIINGRHETTRATISSNNSFGSARSLSSEEVEVDTKTLDALLSDQNPIYRIGFIKIDTEGHELETWTGAQWTIEIHKPSLCIEIERQQGGDSIRFLDEIRSFNYMAVLTDGGKIVEDVRFTEGRFATILDDVKTANRYFIHGENREAYGL